MSTKLYKVYTALHLLLTFPLLPWTFIWKQENLNIAAMMLRATSKHKTFLKAEQEISMIIIYAVHKFPRSLTKDPKSADIVEN